MDEFSFTSDQQLPLRFNIAPTQQIAVVLAGGEGRELACMQWGLIPSWAPDASMGSRMINARSETADVKPSFRTAFKKRRCLVLADGYFEWKKIVSGKQPYYIRLENDHPFGMAGLWESWHGPKQAPLETPCRSCTILTTDANEQTQAIHDRMPVILDPNDFDLWLDPQMQDPETVKPLLVPYAVDSLRMDPVSRLVNNPRNDVPECIEVQRDLF